MYLTPVSACILHRDSTDIIAVKIKYPPDTQAPRQAKPKVPDAAAQPMPRDSSPPKQQPSDTPQSVRRQLAPSASMDSLARATSPPSSSDRLAQMAQHAPPLAAPIETRSIPRSESQNIADAARSLPNGGPPQRPKRDDDEDFRRAMSPTNGPVSPVQSTYPVRVTSPNGVGPASPPQTRKNGFNPSVRGTRSPSPRLRMADNPERPAPPPDAFYYGRSPTTNGFSGRPSSLSGSGDVIRELKAKDAEVEAGRRREAALRMILGRAVQQGFVTDEEEKDLPNGDVVADEQVVRKLADALVRLKQEKAAIQVSHRDSSETMDRD